MAYSYIGLQNCVLDIGMLCVYFIALCVHFNVFLVVWVAIMMIHIVSGKKATIFWHNFYKVKHRFVVFGTNHPDTSVY